MRAEVRHLAPNAHADWQAFVDDPSPDPWDDYGWFHVTVGTPGVDGGNDFQVCVATPKAIGRLRRAREVPGIVVDRFDAASVHAAIHERIASVEGDSWDDIVTQLRAFMRWEYEGMTR